MADPLEAIQRALTCSFCLTQFGRVVKFIPDCGMFICGRCYDYLEGTLDHSRKFKCSACRQHHVLSEKGLPDCKQLPNLQETPIQKPLSPQEERLKLVVDNVRKELFKLQAFDSREYVEQRCEQLELEVCEAAQLAVQRISDIERVLRKQIKEYRQRCLDALEVRLSVSCGPLQITTHKTKSDLDALSTAIDDFAKIWDSYFGRLNSLASDRELEDAVGYGDIFQDRLRELDREMRNNALNGTLMQFKASGSLLAERSDLGELLEVPTKPGQILVKEIELQETPSLTLIGHSDRIKQVIFLPDGRLASCSWDQSIKVWDTSSGKELFTLEGHSYVVYTIAMLPNGLLASGSVDQAIKVWNLKERRVVRTLEEHKGSIISLKVLKNGHLVSCSWDNTMKVWNPYLSKNNLLATISVHEKDLSVIPLGTISNDFLVACSRDQDGADDVNTLRVWDPTRGKLIKTISTGLKRVRSMLVLSNDQIAIGSSSGTIKVIDLIGHQTIRIKEKAHDEAVTCLLQLSNGNLVSAGRDKDSSASSFYSIKVWNLADLSLLQCILSFHTDEIHSLSISQDETLLASGSWDQTINMWPITTKFIQLDKKASPV